MKFEELRDLEATVIVSVKGAPNHHALMAVLPLTAMKELPTFSQKDQVKNKKENWYDLYAANTQFIYKSLGEPDEKSLQHQFKGVKVRMVKGSIDRKMAFEQFPEEFIMAQVLSKVHDSISGKMEGVSFTYASNDLNFKAKWAYGRNKFVVLTD